MFSNRTLDSASPHYLDCFTVDELADYITGKTDSTRRKKIFHHLNLEKCAHCRRLFEEAEAVAENRESNSESDSLEETDASFSDPGRLEWLMRKNRAQKEAPAAPDALKKGQIWTTSQQVKDDSGEIINTVRYAYPVLIIDPGADSSSSFSNIIKVAPISVDTDFVHPGHSLALAREHLSYSAIIEAFNEKPILADNLKKFRSTLTAEEMAEYYRTRNAFITGKYEDPDSEVALWERKELQLTKYLSAAANEAIWENDEVLELSELEEAEIKATPESTAEPELEKNVPNNVINFPTPSTSAIPIEKKRSAYPDLSSPIPAIELVQYRLAAADADLFVPELQPHILYARPALKIAIIQRRNAVFCQILVGSDKTDRNKPEKVALSINKKLQKLTERYPQVYEVKLGEVGEMSEKLDLECQYGEWTLSFTPRFKVSKD